MRTYLFAVSILSLLLLGACHSGSPLEKRATGLAYEVVVTAPHEYWNGEVGEMIKADLQSDVPGLPQSEPSMRITYAQPKDFNGLLTYVRNIVIVNIDPQFYTQVGVGVERDRWANGQLVITVNAPNRNELVSYFAEHPRMMVDAFTREEMGRAAALYEKSHSPLVYEKVKQKFNVEFKVPESMTYFRDTTGFFWASNNAPTGRMDIVVYDFPYRDADTFTRDYLINKRDSVMKLNMPGSFPDSYMTTEVRHVMPDYTPITVHNKYCGVLRGLWRMQGDMMGGPFVSHARLDEENNRVVVVEGFVYSPESEKRSYMRRLEASLYTLRIPGDSAPESNVATTGEMK